MGKMESSIPLSAKLLAVKRKCCPRIKVFTVTFNAI